MSQRPVAPELFELLETYAEELADGVVSVDDAVESRSNVVAFLTGFFEQFFRNVVRVEIRYPSPDDQLVASKARASRNDLSDEELALVRDYERLCELIPDIHGSEYGGSDELFARFHQEYLIDAVDDIVAWSQTTGDDQLIKAVEQASTQLTDAVNG